MAAVRFATKPSTEHESTLRRLSRRSDRAIDALRLGDRHTIADGTDLPTGVSERLAGFVTGAEQLRALRTSVLDRRSGWADTYERYTTTISTAFGVGGALTGIQDADLGSDARVLLEFARAGEAPAQEDALLAGARLAGTLDRERLRLFTGAVDTRRTLTEAAGVDLRGPERAAWRELAGGSAYADLRAVEDEVLASHPGAQALHAAPEAAWKSVHARVRDDMRGIEADAGHEVADRADPFTRALLSPAGAAVLLGLAAVAASLVISVRIGRGLVVELVSLRNDALEIARRKLPHAMRRLRAGEEIDVDAEAPPGPPAEDETGQVAEALGTVHRAALRAAVERAELAGGISGVFVNLARRSQILVHRQLNLLDSMERRSDDPDELSDLFRLDHLTTRMRRHAESLIILSGAAPGRAWRMPVSLTNVVRAAVSEIEDYARVEVRQLPEAKVGGAAVADLTHLGGTRGERRPVLAAPHARADHRGTGRQRLRRGGRGPGARHGQGDPGRGQSPDRTVRGPRPVRQRPARPVRGEPSLRPPRHQGPPANLALRRHHRGGPPPHHPAAQRHAGTFPRATAEARPQPAEREYARVAAAPHQEPVEQSADRRALMAPVDSARQTSVDGPSEPPPGVTTLRPHRPPPEPERTDELPRRVRQAHLAPQLREQPTGQSAQAATPRADDERTPELVRDRMAAYRDGWARGGGRAPGRGVTHGPATGSDSSEGDPA